MYASIQANRGRRTPEAWRDAAFLLAVLALGILCVCAGSGCAEIAALRYDAVAREVIDGDIAARAKRARAAISAAPQEIDAVAMDADLCAIEELATTGVHRAQSAQLFWGVDKDEIKCAIATSGNPSPEDDRQVVTMAGIALEKHRRRWWPRTGKEVRESVAAFAGQLARAVIVEVPRAIIPWWLWPIIIVLVLCSGGAYAWSRYQKWVVLPRIKRETEEARKQLMHKEKALDQYDEGIEALPSILRQYVGKGVELQVEHARRNAARKAERQRAMDAMLPIRKKTDAVMAAVHQTCEERERESSELAAPAPDDPTPEG
jgi:hypothetical protein